MYINHAMVLCLNDLRHARIYIVHMETSLLPVKVCESRPLFYTYIVQGAIFNFSCCERGLGFAVSTDAVFFDMQGVQHEDLFYNQWAIHSIGQLIWIVVNIRLNHTAFFLACRCEGTHPATSRTVKSS